MLTVANFSRERRSGRSCSSMPITPLSPHVAASLQPRGGAVTMELLEQIKRRALFGEGQLRYRHDIQRDHPKGYQARTDAAPARGPCSPAAWNLNQSG